MSFLEHPAKVEHQPSPSPTAVRRRDLRAIFADGVAYSVMVGVGESYLPAFGLAVGLGEVAAGLLATLPMLAGAIFQLGTPWGVRRVGSYRRWVVVCAWLQALSFLPLVIGALAGAIPGWAVYVVAAFYWATGMATSPAWNSWVGRLVPRTLRPRFFALRTRACHVACFLGLLGGGLLLETGEARGQMLSAFALSFGIAASFRIISAGFLDSQSDVPLDRKKMRSVSGPDFMRRLHSGRDGKVIAYMLSVQVAVLIASPFFTPYMLEHLELSYARYMTLLGAAFMGKTLALPLLGRLAFRRGISVVLWIGGLGIIPAAAFWLVSDSFVYLVAAQVLAGSLWAAYELATLLLFFETIDEAERTSFLSIYNVANAGALTIGSTLGALFITWQGELASTYLALFTLSTGMRLFSLLFLKRLGRLERVPVRLPIATRVVGVRPSAGSMERPVLPSLESQGERPSDSG